MCILIFFSLLWTSPIIRGSGSPLPVSGRLQGRGGSFDTTGQWEPMGDVTTPRISSSYPVLSDTGELELWDHMTRSEWTKEKNRVNSRSLKKKTVDFQMKANSLPLTAENVDPSAPPPPSIHINMWTHTSGGGASIKEIYTLLHIAAHNGEQ